MARPIKPSDLLAPPPPMDPPSDRREIVIKVNHRNTLRRIGAYVHGQLMDHNMNKLRAKIISLFKFSPDAEFILTYTDEDGDVVTLDDDDELRDAVIAQRLNPLRINIKLRLSTIAGIDARSEASLTASNSPESGTKPLNIRSAVDEALKSVPEPFRSVMSDLSGDVLKLAQFAEYFSKLALSNASHHYDGAIGELSGQTGKVPADPLDLNVGVESKDSGVPAKETNTAVPVSPAQKQHVCGNIVQGFGTTATASVNLNQDTDGKKNVSPNPLDDSVMHGVSNSKQLPGNAPAPPTSENGVCDHSDGPADRRIGALPTDFPFQMVPIPERWSSPMMQTNVPFQMGPIPKHRSSPMIKHPNKRSNSFHKYAPGIFHGGVQCDGCGMLPIMGLRFHSKVKDDYDLCHYCFSRMGNEADYTRIDRLVDSPPPFPPLLSKMFHSHNYDCSASAMHGCRSKSSVTLESLFIQDVTVLDGTVMDPCTHFTKIWRMRNNGTVAWPLGTQLVWVGGDQFGDQGSTDLEIPANGFPVEGELDIAIDFTAPSVPGRYVSYWRMASPSGQRFGQRVWVLIKVDYSSPNTPVSSSARLPLNLNLPPEGNCPTGFSIIDVAPFDVEFPEANTTCRSEVGHPVQLVDSVLDATNDGLSQPTQPAVVPPTSSEPLVHLPSVSSSLVAPPSEPNANDGKQVEQTLLKKLQEMGFNQTPLNKEILRKNNYDLEQCMNDPDVFADDWDLLLAEMEEMGFSDKELNSKMLIKNGGSIKRAVLDLVAGEKS
ncbi:protein NBR1-like protein [Iris pallida]|uniref:Protein NBR1-like protein n=1 Tax=Iris pallida TaxID=29817 RepID=A0AAX6HKC4_IRIPA|nr:protein NBR1-like protein [Iris pallida]